jgi:hypothetical protein
LKDEGPDELMRWLPIILDLARWHQSAHYTFF